MLNVLVFVLFCFLLFYLFFCLLQPHRGVCWLFASKCTLSTLFLPCSCYPGFGSSTNAVYMRILMLCLAISCLMLMGVFCCCCMNWGRGVWVSCSFCSRCEA
uniref:Uncharacterized protein n=1 Tax=Anopheles darlingi TaxID=43151 RepID=A0A2M4D0Z3_ANODA